jgi:hypothetical protein
MLKLKSDPFIRAVGALHSMNGMCLAFKTEGKLVGNLLEAHRKELEKVALALQDALHKTLCKSWSPLLPENRMSGFFRGSREKL